MKRSSIWLPAIAAGAALCAGESALADDTVSHVLGAENLETLHATVMPDGTLKVSHEPPQAESAESSAANAKAEECPEKATPEEHPEK